MVRIQVLTTLLTLSFTRAVYYTNSSEYADGGLGPFPVQSYHSSNVTSLVKSHYTSLDEPNMDSQIGQHSISMFIHLQLLNQAPYS